MPTDTALSPELVASFLRKSVGEAKSVRIVSRYGNHDLGVSECWVGLDGIVYLSVLAPAEGLVDFTPRQGATLHKCPKCGVMTNHPMHEC